MTRRRDNRIYFSCLSLFVCFIYIYCVYCVSYVCIYLFWAWYINVRWMEQIIDRDLCYIMIVCVCLFIQSFIQLQSFRFKKMKEKMRLVFSSLCGLFVWYFKVKMFEIMVQSTTHMRIHTHFRNIRKPRLPLTQKKSSKNQMSSVPRAGAC